jgi:hypothetical protein
MPKELLFSITAADCDWTYLHKRGVVTNSEPQAFPGYNTNPFGCYIPKNR